MNQEYLSELKFAFEKAFTKASRNSAIAELHSKPELEGQFKLPAHAHLNNYFMAVALAKPREEQEELYSAFITELQKQGVYHGEVWDRKVKDHVKRASEKLEHNSDDTPHGPHEAPEVHAA